MASTPAKKPGYDGFRLVQTRNIFDSRRSGDALVQSGTVPVQAPAAVATVADFAALTGILISDQKKLAFFSGSRPEFNKVLSVNAVFAGGTISKITPANIEVQRGGKAITIAVGQTVPLNGSAPASAPSNPAPAPATAPSSDTAPASSDKDAVLRRMMERRQKELK